MHQDFANTFSNFHIAELQLENQITGTISVRISVAFKNCAQVPEITQCHF